MNCFSLTLFLLNSAVLLTYARDTLEKSQLEQYEGVSYLTYTKNNRKNSVNIREVDFDDDYTTVFVIHGFKSENIDKPLQIKNDIFQFDLNVGRVIIVSWLEYSDAAGRR